MHVLKEHSDKITERIDKFTVKQLLLIVSGFGSYFVDRISVKNSPPEIKLILLAISEQITKILNNSKVPNSPHGSRPLTFY